jgi:hypothetical protein
MTDPVNADKFARKCSNLIAMAELLASEARGKALALLKAERDGKWVLKRTNNLPAALSHIIGSRQISQPSQTSHQFAHGNSQQGRHSKMDMNMNNSHYSSYISNTKQQQQQQQQQRQHGSGDGCNAERSESAPAILQLGKRFVGVRVRVGVVGACIVA